MGAEKIKDVPKQVTAEATLKLKLGVAADFRKEDFETSTGVTKKVYKPKIGQPYWLRSINDKSFMNNCYFINEDTDWIQFKIYLANQQIWVPLTNGEMLDQDV